MASSELPHKYFLSQEQRQFYDDNGYLVIKQLIDFASLYSYRQRFIQISKGLVPDALISIVKERSLKNKGLTGEAVINKLQGIAHDEVFATYIDNPRLVHVVSQLIGDNDINAMHTMFINKPPGTSRHPAHQDLFYFPFRPAEKIVGAWTAVDHVTEENGCLYVVPGSHKDQQLRPHEELPDAMKLYLAVKDENDIKSKARIVNLEMSPGDTVMLHPLLIHGSGPNNSQNYRKSISCHYASASCYYIDMNDGVQKMMARNVEEEAHKRGFQGVTMTDVYKLSSRPVKSHL